MLLMNAEVVPAVRSFFDKKAQDLFMKVIEHGAEQLQQLWKNWIRLLRTLQIKRVV